MRGSDEKIYRLLRSAAQVKDETPSSAPFGFETRVVALWRASVRNTNGSGVARLVRRVALLSGAVIVLATAGAIREFQQSREMSEPFTNDFAIADSAIQDETMP